MELRDYIRIIRRSWILIIVTAFAGFAAAGTLSVFTKPQYRATAQVFVSTQSSGSVQELVQGSTFTQQRVKTYAGLVKTPIVLLPVISGLQLQMTADELAKTVTASAPLDTTLIEISAESPDAVKAADIANATSESLTNVVKSIESTGSQGTAQVKLTRVEEAEVPASPISPNVPLYLVVGAVLGAVLGLSIAVLRHMLDNRIRSERDVTAINPAPILGGIVFDPKAAKRPLIVHEDPRSPRAEAFRTLRTNIRFVDVARGSRSFVITSSIESEGKSSTASNLAIALDKAGHKVVVVDADLRRPRLAEYMGLEGAIGLTDVLIGRVDLEDALQEWGGGGLHVLPAGHIPPNPSELLGSAAMQALVRELEKDFDYVLFDAPPLLPVTDAAILSTTAGGAIVVVAAGRTHRNHVAAAVMALENVGANLFGFVLTMLPAQGAGTYGYGIYGYGSYGESEGAMSPPELAPVRRHERKRMARS